MSAKPFSGRDLFDELAQFLPRQVPGELLEQSPASASDTSILKVPPELLAELRDLLAGEWPALRDSLAFNESKAFAMKLEALARRWEYPPLNRYAQALARHADSYSVTELELHLFEFTSLVERLERRVSA